MSEVHLPSVMETRLRYCHILLWVMVYIAMSDQTFTEPSTTYSDIAIGAGIESTSRCSSGTQGCVSNGCSNTDTGDVTGQFTEIQGSSQCQQSVTGAPSSLDTNKYSMFINSTTGSCSNTKSVASSTGYTLSFWIKTNFPGSGGR